jgi:hypothetical protein
MLLTGQKTERYLGLKASIQNKLDLFDPETDFFPNIQNYEKGNSVENGSCKFLYISWKKETVKTGKVLCA